MEPDVSFSTTDLTQKESMGEEKILSLRAKMLTKPWKE